MSLPVGVNTFLFADVEESAKLWENNPEAMQEAISRLDTLVAEAVVANQGVLVKNRGEGDSMLLVFANAQEALRASCHFQRLCLQEDWRPETPLKLRS